MNILIADDHHLIIEGLQLYLRNQYPNANIYSADDIMVLQTILQKNSIDILFLDIKLGKVDSRDVLSDLLKSYPTVKIIIISTLGDPYIVENVFKKGVHGYVLKSDPNSELSAAISAINNQEIFLSKGIKHAVNAHKLKAVSKIQLTPREKEILKLILQEMTMKEIAEVLFLAEKTIENHRANIMMKLGVKNTAGMVKKAILEGLVD